MSYKTSEFSFNHLNTEKMSVNLKINFADVLNINDEAGLELNIKIGNLISIDGQKQMQVIPRYVMGSKKATGLAEGKISYAGTLVFGVISFSSFVEIKKTIKEFLDGKNSGDEKIINYLKTLETITSFSSLPLFNIKITCGDGSEDKKIITKEFKNVKLASRGSNVGVSSILVHEAYNFTCEKIEPLKEETE